MSDNDYTNEFWVDQSPTRVLAVIGEVGAYWAPPGNLANATIEGMAGRQGSEFIYRDRGFEYCKFRVTEIVPERRIVWEVLDARLNGVEDRDEWTGTHVIFDLIPEHNGTRLRFTHRGLTPSLECYRECSRGWNGVIADSLQALLNGHPWTPTREGSTST